MPEQLEGKATGPQLQVKEVARSREPVLKREALTNIHANILTEQYGEYTIVVKKDSTNLEVYDSRGEMVRDFEGKISGQLGRGHKYLLDTSEIHRISIISDGKTGVVVRNNLINPKSGNNDDLSNFAVGYRTTDSDQPLSPRNWVKLDKEELEYSYRGFLGDLKGMQVQYRAARKIIPARKNNIRLVAVMDEGVMILASKQSFGEPWKDSIKGVGRNLCVDPADPSVIYYVPGEDPTDITKVIVDSEKTPQPSQAPLPKRYGSIKNLELDPKGSFFLLETGEGIVFLRKDTLEEIGSVKDLYRAHFDPSGKIRAINKDGFLVTYEADFARLNLEIEKKRLADSVKGIKPEDLFRPEGQQVQEVETTPQVAEKMLPIKEQFGPTFDDQIKKVTSLEDVSRVSAALEKLIAQLRASGLKQEEIDFVVSDIKSSIGAKQKELEAKQKEEAKPVAEGIIDRITGKINANFSLATISDIKAELLRLKPLEGFLDPWTRDRISVLEKELSSKSEELFRTQGGPIVKQVEDLVGGIRGKLDTMTNMIQFNDWMEFSLPQLTARLAEIASQVPLEASEIQERILAQRRILQDMAQQAKIKFTTEYAKVRERANELTSARLDLVKNDLKGLIERLQSRGFKNRADAERYIEGSDARKALEAEIAAIERDDPDTAAMLKRELSVSLANSLYAIERGVTEISETGAQMIHFGNTLFPRWEAKVKEVRQKQANLIFLPNEKTVGAGVTADEIYGDIGLKVINSRGHVEDIRLYQGWDKEREVRLGIGSLIPPSYVSHAEFDEIRNQYLDWGRGEKSQIRLDLKRKAKVIKDLRGRKDTEEYRNALKDYTDFYAKNHIAILNRVDRVKKAPETEYENDKGFVPEWQSHWVVDKDTENYLSEMAQSLKMQLDLQEGMVTLKGHAGTGKDVLVKMFSNMTHRPYFTIDGTKWTTEFELSEDIVLESKEGASQTVKVPSVVLNAITTPGAIMYFNEFNAMPEQTQIFLHALLDEKRTLTLKTSSGKTVKAVSSVLLVGSMNPNYKGTFEPQFATRSRMVSIEVNYPSLFGEKDPEDSNTNKPYNPSEALRIAREVKSLSDLTYEPNLERNEFVKMWDKYVNGIANDGVAPSATQKFDIDTILALIQFSNKLREDFILQFEKTPESRRALPVTQPITGREMRRAAYALNQMTLDDRKGDPEEAARGLIEKFFLSHIDSKEDREKIKTAMKMWRSQKRPAGTH